ncbi:MAG: hypothetical protein EOP05_10790 [Proteobacteria bacterium]|nr:MAG: hypothetical protein EOP05_10790 [Pseudomonadota bacterium]
MPRPSRTGAKLKRDLLKMAASALLTALVALNAGCNYSVEKVSRGAAPGSKPTTKPTPANGTDGSTGGVESPQEELPSFNQDLAPIFKTACVSCHNDKHRVANLSVQSYEEIVSNPRAVVPGDAENSGIYASVTDDYMPPSYAVQRGESRILTEEEKRALKLWIEAGAPNN